MGVDGLQVPESRRRPTSSTCAEGKTTTITIQQAADKMDRIRLEVGPPKMGKITYSTPCGKFLPILTTHRTKAGETVLIAIRVQPCGGK